MYKGAIQYSKLTVSLSLFFFLQNDVEAPAYLRTPGYAPDRFYTPPYSIKQALWEYC